ncbi:MAG: hypothetical protein Q9192_008491, partial [Flavoplaca navasiana]
RSAMFPPLFLSLIHFNPLIHLTTSTSPHPPPSTPSSSSRLLFHLPSSIFNAANKVLTEQHTSGNKKAEQDASADADEQVKAIRAAGDKQGQKVVDDLLRIVTDVRPEAPERVTQPGQA